MTPGETAKVLLKASVYDRRTVGAADIEGWYEALGDLDLGDCLAAVGRHFRESTDWLMPAHVRRIVKEIRDERHRREPHEIRALPSRFEQDEDRAARLERGMARCADVLKVVAEQVAKRRAAEASQPQTKAEAIHALALVRAREEKRGRA
jgi:hypothetical protein